MKAIVGLIVAAALISPTQAAPSVALHTSTASSIIQVEDGCGRDFHRNERGYCRPNWREWQPEWRACPPGWHLGPERRRCWPN
jgi:hypothetical protein